MGEVQVPVAAEEETDKEDCPLTAEEQYDCALGNVALAFSEFLYWAMQMGRSRTRGATQTLMDISHF